MQQTTTYKLNKPESTDTFSVSPLNENADTLETQLARLDGADAALEARADGLEGRVAALEVHKIAVGVYQASGGVDRNIQVGFTPIAVIVVQQHPDDIESCMMAVTDSFAGSVKIPVLTIVEGGFLVHSGGYNVAINRGTNHYIAFG